ncbi:hypothetical protein [Mycobacterium tuberculosis]
MRLRDAHGNVHFVPKRSN